MKLPLFGRLFSRTPSSPPLTQLMLILAKEPDLDKLMVALLDWLKSSLNLRSTAVLVLQNQEVKHIKQQGFTSAIPFSPADLSTLLSLSGKPSPELTAFCTTHALSQIIPLGQPPQLVGYLLLGITERGTSPDPNYLDQLLPYISLALKSAAAIREITEFNQTLSGHVTERTRELQIAQADAMRLKDEFVFIATHDLATPVTAISGLLDLILAQPNTLPPTVLSQLQLVSAASARLKVLVNDLLQVARSDSGTIRVQVAPLDATPILQNALRQAETLAHQQHVTLSLQLTTDNRLSADAHKLAEIVENLLSNAIKYNHPGGTVTLTSLRDSLHYNLIFQDTGIGIPAAEHARVFTKFFRSDTSEARSRPGTGLGLFVVRMLTEKMGGKVSFTSTAGFGSTFILQFPAL